MRILLALALGLVLAGPAGAAEPWRERAPDTIRIATFNAGLVRKGAGMLVREMDEGGAQIDAVAEIILHVRPDILLLNKFDRDPAHRALTGFAERLRAGFAGLEGLDYPFLYQGPVNTGLPSGHDLDGDGYRRGPRDAFGYGRFPGQYGMALLSRYPIDYDRLRSFRRFLWADMPGADRPLNPDGTPFHSDEVWRDLRLSSISHWDVPVTLPDDLTLHVLASHPTPPVFDGPEDFNGRRNADETRLTLGLIDGARWLTDDRGRTGGLKSGDLFVVTGDLNADPVDGEARRDAITALVTHPRIPRHPLVLLVRVKTHTSSRTTSQGLFHYYEVGGAEPWEGFTGHQCIGLPVIERVPSFVSNSHQDLFNSFETYAFLVSLCYTLSHCSIEEISEWNAGRDQDAGELKIPYVGLSVSSSAVFFLVVTT